MKKFVIDVVERATWTYLEALLGLLAVSGPLNLDTLEAAAVAAIPAGIAVIKGAIAGSFGAKGSAATLPEVLDNTVSEVVGGK